MKISRLIFLLCTMMFAANLYSQVRPKNMWVFRSVLDKRARMVTCALNEKLWVAYDANDCSLYKVWKGGTNGVNFEGAVYNHKHGPQPTSDGAVYMYGVVDKPVWQLYQSGHEVANAKIQFKGYVWMNNKVTLKYSITAKDIEVFIEETPEYIVRNKDKAVGIERVFSVKNLPAGYVLMLEMGVSSLPDYASFVVPSDFIFTEKTEYIGVAGSTFGVKGKLKFTNSTPVNVSTYFINQ